jgi:HK97 family phage prohead protease
MSQIQQGQKNPEAPQRKSLSGLKITDESKGEVSAVIATFNVKDHDGDVTVPGAFKDGTEVRISAYNHKSWEGALPVGRGTITQTDTEAVATMKFFLNTSQGRDTFETVKAMGDLQEWSYSLHNVVSEYKDFNGASARILKSIDVEEVSPVLLGAGIDTRTLAVKNREQFSDHAESVVTDVDALIERAAEVKAMRLAKGKGMGEQSKELLTNLDASLKRLREVLASAPDTDTADALAQELLRHEVRRAT